MARSAAGPIARLGNLHQRLAEIAALQHVDEGLRRVLDAFGHPFAIFQAPVPDIARHLALEFRETVIMIEAKETLHRQALGQDRAPDRWQPVRDRALRPRAAIMRDDAADRDP